MSNNQTIELSQQLEQKQVEQIQQLIAQQSAVYLSKNLIELKALKSIHINNSQLILEFTLPFLWQQGVAQLKADTEAQLKHIAQVESVHFSVNYQIATLARANDQPAINGVKNIIAVTSGKGGVGKSSTAVNLAYALQRLGAKVGILDADIYGPSIPHMLGTQDRHPESPDNAHMVPVAVNGIYSNSIGYLMDPDNATIWRGPMASTALTQLIQETWWPDLDYLIIDMPPGTGDLQLTLSQKIPVTGAVVVTTPQDVALLDAIKGIAMFNKVNIPVLGIIENMSMHICAKCGHHEAIFGTGGAEKVAQKYHVDLLGQISLHIRLREDLDNGTATVMQAPDHEISQAFLQLAEKISIALYWKGSVIPSEIMFREVK